MEFRGITHEKLSSSSESTLLKENELIFYITHRASSSTSRRRNFKVIVFDIPYKGSKKRGFYIYLT